MPLGPRDEPVDREQGHLGARADAIEVLHQGALVDDRIRRE
jgi:hypothetical protein